MAPCADPGDTTWVLVSTLLVLGMMPALAMFEAGLLRSKNTASIIVQVISTLSVLAALWVIVGYTLVFGSDQHGIIGSLEHAFFIGVSYEDCNHGANIPSAAFAIFMCMFACITPLLMTGAYAERVPIRCSVALSIAWEIIVFYPLAHWIWGDGFLMKWGVRDFAGGIVIHTSAGASSLLVAFIVGRRLGFDKYNGAFPPSNLPLATTGATLLWMGWFGFNGGSALKAGVNATTAVVSTQIGACMSAMMWVSLSAFEHKPNVVDSLNGAIAGLAGITPAAGYINSQHSIVLGLLLGITSYFGVKLLKRVLRIDDALDVSVVHGWTGILGSIYVGIGASHDHNPDIENGAFYGGWDLLGKQIVGVLIAAAWAVLWTLIIVKILDRVWGMRVSPEDELQGLDCIEHEETAYHRLRATSVSTAQVPSRGPTAENIHYFLPVANTAHHNNNEPSEQHPLVDPNWRVNMDIQT